MKIHDKRGRLTGYGFACGYVETLRGVRIWMEHGVYHILRGEPGEWRCANTLKEARKIRSSLASTWPMKRA